MELRQYEWLSGSLFLSRHTMARTKQTARKSQEGTAPTQQQAEAKASLPSKGTALTQQQAEKQQQPQQPENKKRTREEHHAPEEQHAEQQPEEKPEEPPKKPMGVYIMFQAEQLEKMMNAQPRERVEPMGVLRRRVSESWYQMNLAARAPYVRKYEEAMSSYKHQLQEYNERKRLQEEQQHAEQQPEPEHAKHECKRRKLEERRKRDKDLKTELQNQLRVLTSSEPKDKDMHMDKMVTMYTALLASHLSLLRKCGDLSATCEELSAKNKDLSATCEKLSANKTDSDSDFDSDSD